MYVSFEKYYFAVCLVYLLIVQILETANFYPIICRPKVHLKSFFLLFKEKVWAKWVSIDDTLAQKLGLELPEGVKKKEILIEVGKKHGESEFYLAFLNSCVTNLV